MTDLLAWRFAFASTRGSSHVAGGLPCQDSSICELIGTADDPVFVAAVSDGAGSASHSEVGSSIACKSFVNEITALVSELGSSQPPDHIQMEAWLADFLTEAQSAADERDLTLRDLACTFVGAVVTPTWSAFCQVGDGAIVVDHDVEDAAGRFEVVFWPEQGQYANETYFATMADATEHLHYRVDNRPVREIAIFSDGLQRMVLDYATREPFQPFFFQMMQPVRRTEAEGHSVDLSQALSSYLASPIVSERTDDDATLILATRLAELVAPPPVPEAEVPTSTPENPASDAPAAAVDGAPEPLTHDS